VAAAAALAPLMMSQTHSRIGRELKATLLVMGLSRTESGHLVRAGFHVEALCKITIIIFESRI
jgi:hypothetical protein